MPKIFRMVCGKRARAFIRKNKKKTKRRTALSLFCAIAASALIICTFSLSSSAFSDGEERESAFSVSACENSQGIISVTLGTADSTRVCGIFAELSFDSERLIFIGAKMSQGLADKGFFLSVEERGGSISVIVDGSENAFQNELVCFEFEPACRSGGITSVEVSVREAYFWDDGYLASLRGGSSSVNVVLSDGEGGASLPKLVSTSVSFDGERTALEISGLFPLNCFAVGFEVFVADLSAIDASGISVSRVIPCGEGEKSASFSLDIPNKSRLCVVITPISYSKGETVRGDDTVVLFQDGKIIG